MRKPKFLRRDPVLDAAHALYVRLVEQARQPAFYERLGVPDTLDGRFDMVSLHAFLLLRRLKREGEAGRRLGQAVFDVMFADMDSSLREMGVGDLGVGKRVKAMASGLYGRIAAYEAGLESGAADLAAALRRNLYGTVQPGEAEVGLMSAYLREQDRHLAGQDGAGLLAGEVGFVPAEPAFRQAAAPEISR